MSILLCFVAVVIILLIYNYKAKDPEPIFGVYQVPGKWYYVKYALFACLYYVRKYSNKNSAAGKDGRAGQGVSAIADPAAMDRAQTLSDHAKAFDAVFFISAKNGDVDDKGIYVMAGCERRPMGMCNGLFYLGLPGKGLLCSKKIPDTVLFGAAIGEFGAEGIKITPVEPMAKWNVAYRGQMWYQNDPTKVVEVDFQGEWKATTKYFDFDSELHPGAIIRSIAREKWSRKYFEGLKTIFGVMHCQGTDRQNDPTKVVEVDFQGEWKATTKYFDFDSELHPGAIIRSIAREKWSRKYFEGLKTAHQSHYEQFGTLKCKLKIENESFEFTLPSFRDHSFGQTRDWTLMHRYAFHHIFLEDGTCISVGVICQPVTASVFEAGVMALPSGEMLPIKWVDLQLHQHGESGAAPRDYGFCFQAGDQVYAVQVLVEYESIHYVSEEWDARMVERFCKYTVNGVPGRGTSEFHYRHKGGRPDEAAKDDPEWYRKMCHKI